jgi:hypothetical protein
MDVDEETIRVAVLVGFEGVSAADRRRSRTSGEWANLDTEEAREVTRCVIGLVIGDIV